MNARNILLLGFLSLVPTLAAQAQTTAPKQPQSVIVARVSAQAPGAINSYIGRVEAVSTVELQARVTGFLEKRNFIEGAAVSKDEVLYEIERETYKAEVDKYTATVEGATATVDDNQKTLDRMIYLRDNEDEPQAKVDSAKADLLSSQATLDEAKADLEEAKINLGYTRILSPFDGRISKTEINVGNVVDSNSGTLATVVSIDPVYVSFYVSERTLLEERRKGLIDNNSSGLAISITLADGESYPEKGKITYVDIEVDESTDTIELRATFPNPDKVLIPGQFVTVSTEDPSAKPVITVPQTALQLDKKGHFVFTVDGSDKVVRTDIQLGKQISGLWEVKSGLSEGQRVIVQGLQKIRAGMTVSPVEQGS